MYSFRALHRQGLALGIPWHQGAELPELSPRAAGPRGARQGPEGGASPARRRPRPGAGGPAGDGDAERRLCADA